MRMAAVAVFLLASTYGGAAAAATRSWTVTREQWGSPQEAGQVIAIRALRSAVQSLDKVPGARLAVIHNGGEDGIFWASRVEGWLVSLGVPAARIVDSTGAVSSNELRLELLRPGQRGGP